MTRPSPTSGLRCVAAVVVVVAAAGLTGCSPSRAPATVSGSPAPVGSSAPGPPGGPTTSASPRSPSPTSTVGPALTGLPYVPAGFTLPPGAVVESHDVVGTQTEVVLTAPPAAVAVAYLRSEITGLGYGQRGQRSSGDITAYAYRLGASVLSVSGGSAGGHDVTALVFQND